MEEELVFHRGRGSISRLSSSLPAARRLCRLSRLCGRKRSGWSGDRGRGGGGGRARRPRQRRFPLLRIVELISEEMAIALEWIARQQGVIDRFDEESDEDEGGEGEEDEGYGRRHRYHCPLVIWRLRRPNGGEEHAERGIVAEIGKVSDPGLFADGEVDVAGLLPVKRDIREISNHRRRTHSWIRIKRYTIYEEDGIQVVCHRIATGSVVEEHIRLIALVRVYRVSWQRIHCNHQTRNKDEMSGHEM